MLHARHPDYADGRVSVERRGARGRGARGALLVVSLCLASSALGAQRPVLLELRPRVGDTLRVRVDQRVEVSGVREGGDTTRTVTTTTQLQTRCVVESADSAGATVVASTDSVRIASTGEKRGEMERARRTLEGRSGRLRMAPDGAAELVDDGQPQPAELRALFARMPATLPPRPVVVGETWTRTMELPGASGIASAGALTATFRLDSLARGGELAYVSMHGALGRSPGARGGDAASRVTMSGVVSGGMTIDRPRGWMTDARTTLTVTSIVAPPPGVAGPPLRVRLRMTQWLRSQ